MRRSIFLFLLILFINCCHIIDKDSLEYSYQSNTFLEEGNLKEAEIAIKKALEIDDNNYVAYNNLGVLNIKLDQPEGVVVGPFLKSISIKSNYLPAIFNVANYYLKIKKYSNSIIYCTKYIELTKNEKDLSVPIEHIYAIRGESKNNLRQYNEAQVDLKYAIEMNPNDAGAFKELGSAYRNIHRYKEAIENYSIAIAINNDYAQAYNGLGLCYDTGLKDFDKALENYNKAIELDPKDGTYLFNRGAFLFDNGYKEKAFQDLYKADSLGKTDAKEYLKKY